MNYFHYLRKKFPVYLISGVVLSLVVFMAVSFHRYDNHLFNVLFDLQTMGLNKNKIQDKVEEIDSILRYFKNKYQLDITDINSEAQILKSLDKLKDHIPEARITATKFTRDMGAMLLPVEIQFNIDSYNMLVHVVAYLDSFRVPDYKIKGLQISESSPGAFVLQVSGALTMPEFN